ncbi:MAG: hypothetical protein JWL69_1338 [Phycisphaerales bacterium]|nr:hypothetical protein [Phycisphaerales bacterium]MDB5354182.1 hypothetical protein [Phycisphaerales bacterium]
MSPEFEEKSYEVAADGELRLNSADFYSPGQVAEGILGFDIATFQPHTSPVWNYIQAAAPGGMRLLPNLWPNGFRPPLNVNLPSYVVSLILQYKRAERMKRANARQHKHWGRGYYRYRIDMDQQQVLVQLEAALAGHAVVRYSAPAFHSYADLENYTRTSQILAQSNYASPQALTTHSAWTYTVPGGVGFANPEPEEIKADSWPALQATLGRDRGITTVLQHLRDIAQAILDSRLGAEIILPQTAPEELSVFKADTRRGLQDLMIISTVLSRLAANWWLRVQSLPH